MTKKNKRYCDRCGKEMPKLIDFSSPDMNLREYDQLRKGRKTQNGTYSGKAIDICQECMCDFEDNWIQNK